MAHRRLSIIDLSRHGHQPMHFAGCRLVYNGEFYNYRSIRKELESRGHRFHGCSDSEVLLHGWVEWGDGILERINGIYAFAVWDGKSRTLLLARDPMGVKPLYYTETTSGFAFASELKALTALPDLDRSIDPQAVDACLGHLWLPSPSTMFRAVRKLEPGHLLAVRDGRIVSRRPPHAPPFIPTPGQQTEYPRRAAAERLSEQLDRAVRRQLVSDVPVGAFLSGGLDSSAVVALARRRLDRLPCFTITFRDRSMADEGFADDLPYARRVARHLGVTLHEVEVGAALIDGLEQMVWQLDEPQADPAPLQAALICRAAHEAGIKVLLSGTGGDDLFTGYRRHRALLLERWWRWWPAAIRRRLQRFAATLPHSSGTGRRIARAFRFAGVDEEERIVGYFRWLDPERQRCLYSPEFRDAVGTPAPLRDFLRTLPDGLTPLQRMLALEQRFFLADHNLNYTDKSGMAYGVEVRVPLLDLELVRFANRLPDRYKQRGATGKWLFKQAMEGVLPREVIHRPKTGFGAPVRRWLHHDLREMVGDLLSEEGIRRRGWFDPQAVRRMIADDAAGRIDAAYSIFAMLCMELWCRRFVDRRQEWG
ncbi:MAG: asparagine synthase (glutamine-hydrolyzing) [Zetaproteobacteria bacterium]|nr:MAG: asparagine synthase (glutamine-hydrolyzing) [Zetaproteobacteria bacterium]